MRVDDAADLGMILVEGGVHGHHGTLDGRQLALEERPVEGDADDAVRPQPTE